MIGADIDGGAAAKGSGASGFDPAADLTGDGFVASSDFLRLGTRFGGVPGPSGFGCAGNVGGCAAMCAP